MKRVKFTPRQERILREQIIDAEHPGALLRDFHAVVDFVGLQGVKAAGKYHLLPLESIGELDARLSRPLCLEMKRPQLRSHPYLQGLHLLLRASGLSRLEGGGAQTRLVLDPSMLAQWNHLNPTEQYFTLLEAWLRIGRAEMVGESGTAFGDLLLPCLQTWQYLPAKGQQFNVEKPQTVYVSGIGREFYQLALMDLFGLLEVEHPPPGVTPWCPAALRHVPFGDALCTLLAEQAFSPLPAAFLEEEVSLQSLRFGAWQPIFQPYFPQWRENPHLAEIAPAKGTFIFRVALGKVWRRIALRATDSVDDLVAWILKSVNFSSDHLYELVCPDRFGRILRILHPYMEAKGEGLSGAEVHLGDLPLALRQSMTLVYDFGDNWRFNVTLEAIEPPKAKIKAPRILESHGRSPEQYPSWDE